MTKKQYDVAIAYRTYLGTKPLRDKVIFKEDKFKFEQFCLSSLKKSLGNLKIKIWALLDSCPPEWEDLFREFFNKDELIIINLNSAGEVKSIKIAMDILLKQTYSDFVYMAEDDYYYLANQFEQMIKFLKNNSDVDFITPWDHLDYYTYELHDYPSKIKVYAGKHWRIVSTTCNTYLTTKKKLSRVYHLFINTYTAKNIFDKYFIKNNKFLRKLFKDLITYPRDNNVWLSLTKINIFNFFKIFRSYYTNGRVFSTYFRTWRYNFKQILFGKKWNLWCPIPSIATQLEEPSLAPNIDWKSIFTEKV